MELKSSSVGETFTGASGQCRLSGGIRPLRTVAARLDFAPTRVQLLLTTSRLASERWNFVVRARSERIVSCYDADLSADGKYLAITTSGSGQEAGHLLLYDVASQRLVAKCFGGGHRGVAFIGSPLRLVSAGWAGGTTAAVLITAVPSGSRLDRITFPQMNINSNHAVVSSEDGEHFAVGRSLWNSRTLRKNFGGRKRRSTDWTLFSVAPDGTSLLAGELSQLELWSNRESKSIDLAAKGGRKAGAIAPNGRLATVAISNAVYILDLQSYAPLEEVAVQNRDVCAVRFSSDGRFMATAFDDGSTCIWDISDLIATQE